MKPVLLVPQTGLLGGAERVLLDWSRALDRPAVLACPPGPLAEAATAAGLDVAGLPARSLRGGPRGLARLAARARDIARLTRRYRPAVVVASGLRPALAAAAAPLHGARLVTVYHDLAYARAARLAARRGTSIATSNAVGQLVQAGHVIHPGVDLTYWALPDPPPGPPRALVLGALVRVKRVELALEIAARVPELELEIAGAALPGDAPGYAEALRARASQPDLDGRVRFLGALADPRPALARAHCLLHCADREAFGLALVEALAAGRPVAAPAAGGPLEIVTPDCGRLFPPGDAAQAAAALREVVTDSSLRAGARARAAAFDGAQAARRFAALIETAAA
ncbi:MAG TPA: glycosyltransferase [Solirubrobacter sp.]|nr:glycosyltransferase [Solirubrobacter sp.]